MTKMKRVLVLLGALCVVAGPLSSADGRGRLPPVCGYSGIWCPEPQL